MKALWSLLEAFFTYIHPQRKFFIVFQQDKTRLFFMMFVYPFLVILFKKSAPQQFFSERVFGVIQTARIAALNRYDIAALSPQTKLYGPIVPHPTIDGKKSVNNKTEIYQNNGEDE